MVKRAAVTLMMLLVVAGMSGMVQAAGDAAKGKGTFQQYCTGCHGAAGKGDGAAAASMNPKPRDLTDKAVNASLKDDSLLKLITQGGQAVGKSPLMPKFSLSEDRVKDLIAFIRSLAK